MSNRDMHAVEKLYREYAVHVIAKDTKKIVDYICPDLFHYMPREEMIYAMDEAYNNPGMNIQIIDMQPGLFFETFEVKDRKYLPFTGSAHLKIKFNKDPSARKGEVHSKAVMIFEKLKADHGDHNVTYDADSGTVEAHTTSYTLAVSDENKKKNWHFLEIKYNLLELYSKFLPEPIIYMLKRFFHPAENETDDAVLDQYSAERRGVVSDEDFEDGHEEESGGKEKRMYLTGWEISFNSDQHCHDFMATQATDKKTAQKASAAIELIFVNDQLVKAYNWEDGDRHERPLSEDEIGMPFRNYPLNKYYELVEDPMGQHSLGGEIPPGFQLPENNCVVPFQYLGQISNKDPNFSWLPFTLHLACPVYLNFEKLFLDYSDPMRPFIVNREEVEAADSSFEEEMDRNSEIIFQSEPFRFSESQTTSYPGHAGMPNWIQYPDIQRCPKTGKLMKFVCQLNGGVPVKRTNVHPRDENYRGYFETMNFWGDGDLYVFFQPESKVACYLIQNT